MGNRGPACGESAFPADEKGILGQPPKKSSERYPPKKNAVSFFKNETAFF